jgi:transposase InsO family protein
VSAAKKATTSKTEEPETSGAELDKADDVAGDEAAPAKEAAAPRKSLGPKEPPAFLWKLIGHSGGMAVTLFKAAEREDIEAQFERLRREGYYTDLRIVDINEKIVHPNPPPPERKPAKRAAKEKKQAPAKASASTAARSKGGQRTPKGAATTGSAATKRSSRAKKSESSGSAKKAGAAKTARRAIKKKK